MSDYLSEEKINEFETRFKSIKDEAGGKCTQLGSATGFQAFEQGISANHRSKMVSCSDSTPRIA